MELKGQVTSTRNYGFYGKIKGKIEYLFGGFLVEVIVSVVFSIVGLFILYIVIETAEGKVLTVQ